MAKTKRHSRAQTQSTFVATQIGNLQTSNYAAATDETIKGIDIFWKIFEQEGQNAQKHGNLFECIEAAKFNADAALKRSLLRAEITAADGNRTSQADILVKSGSKTVREVQAKAEKSHYSMAGNHMRSKYKGMQRLVPSDKAEDVKKFVEDRANSQHALAEEYQDVSNNLVGKLQHDEISSPGTTYDETIEAKTNPNVYTKKIELEKWKSEAENTGKKALLVGAILGGGISAVSNFSKVYKGEKDFKDGLRDVGEDAVKSGAKSGVIGVGGTAIRYGAYKKGLTVLTKANVATAVAAGLVDVGVSILAWSKGDLNSHELMEKLGQTGVGVTYGMFGGAVMGTLVAGPAAVAAATIGGYLLANFAYQSTVTILKEADLSEELAARVKALNDAAIAQMQIQREVFEQEMQNRLGIIQKDFQFCFDIIDQSLYQNDHKKAISALANLAGFFGRKLKFDGFESFDAFMSDPETKLVL